MGSKAEQVNILIDQIGWGAYNNLSFAVCGAAWSSLMMWGSCVSIAIKVAGSDWSLTGYEQGLLGTCHTTGIFLGSYFWGHRSNLYGRLKSLKLVGMLSSICAIFFAASVNYMMIITATVLIGFCNAGSVVAAGTLYSETMPADKSWTMVLLSACFAAGGIVAYAVAIFVLIAGDYGFALWRWVALVAAVLQVVYWLASYLLLESPKFLVRNNLDKEACEVLE